MTRRQAIISVAQVAALVALNVALSIAVRHVPGVSTLFGSATTLMVNLILGVPLLALAAWFGRRDLSRRETFGIAPLSPRVALKWIVFVAVGCKVIAIPLQLVVRAIQGTGGDAAMIRAIEHVANGPIVDTIALAVWAGIWEELVFRGFILGRLRVACRHWVTQARADTLAIVLQAVAFGLVHIWQNTEGQINAALSGLVLGFAVVRCGSIIPGMVGHAAVDLLGLFAARAGVFATKP